MSLSSILKGKDEESKKLQDIIRSIVPKKVLFKTVSKKKAFSDEYNVLVPYKLSKSYYSSIVGIAFDYIAKIVVAREIEDKSVYENINAENGLQRMKRFCNKETYEELSKRYSQKLGIVINESNIRELCGAACFFAKLEQVNNSGMPPKDIKGSLLGDMEEEIIDEVTRLVNVFIEKFIKSGIFKGKVIIKPSFGLHSKFVDGACADICIDGVLYDYKCSKNTGYKWSDVAELIGYYLLHLIGIRIGDQSSDTYNIEIRRVAMYKARVGEIEYVDINDLGDENISSTLKKLMDFWYIK